MFGLSTGLMHICTLYSADFDQPALLSAEQSLTECIPASYVRPLQIHLSIRAGFSWWGAWGPAIGVGDGRGGGTLLPSSSPHKKIQEKYFSVKHRPNVKFGHFRTNVVY